MAEVTNNEQNFEEMLEESLKKLNTDEKVHGVVVGISPTEVYVDVGRKQAGFIPAGELSNDPNVKPEDVVKIGDEMDLLIMKTNDQEGTIMLSKRRVDAMKAGMRLPRPRRTTRFWRARSSRLSRAASSSCTRPCASLCPPLRPPLPAGRT